MAKRKTLTTLMAEDMSQKILEGVLKPGERLPTESELCVHYEVSRTVVREAIARLQSEGVLISIQGRGMFVAEHPHAGKFAIDVAELNTLPDTIALLELRMCVEVESAAFCAINRTEKEATKIRKLMEKVDALHKDPDSVDVHYDYSFHLAIASAAKNAYFHRFLHFLEPIIVPRFRLGHLVRPEFKDEYYNQIHDEHEAVVAAIEQQDPNTARESMRTHLLNSLARFRALAQSSGLGDASTKGTGQFISFMEQLSKNCS
ncbi:MAG: FadR/GntR family transcriptional regulator [Paracoccaceae bacterium]|nr:FadR/GntR family transcriptional regulator [Paracoccaceae bacterium]